MSRPLPGALRCVVLLALVLSLLGLTATTAHADKYDDEDGDAACEGNGCSVHITYTGSGASGTDGAVSSAPPDCWFEPWANVQEAFVTRIIHEIFRAFFPVAFELPVASVEEYADAAKKHTKGKKVDPEWMWHLIECKEGVNQLTSDQAMSVAKSTEWYGLQVARMDLLIGPGEETPAGVSVETLLEAAQDAFTIPEPELTQSPTKRSNGATLVNLPTWFWADNAQESYTITASAGPVSVTLEAEQAGYVLTSPYGSTECTHEQFTTEWTPTTDESDGCVLTFDEPSPADSKGHEVQITSQWDVTWTATGFPQPQELDGLTPSSTIYVPVDESQAVITGVD